MLKFDFKRLLIFGAAAVLLIFLHFINAIRPVETFIVSKLRPLSSALYSSSSFLRANYEKKNDTKDLEGQVKKLEADVVNLTIENARLKTVQEEDYALRQHFNYLSKNNFSYVLANIISQDENQFITIARGTNDGLSVNLPLLDGDGIVVGRIISVKETIAQACLINNPRCKFAATIQNKNKTVGIVQGEMGLTVKMNLIPQTEEIKEGDVVVTSGLEKDIPRGLVIGKVSHVNKDNNELWQNATVEPLIDFNDLIIVSVLTSN